MVNTTLSISLEKSRENEKLASFLQVLKDHPDQIISDAIKSEYIEFLEFALERAKDDNTWGGHVVPKLLQL